MLLKNFYQNKRVLLTGHTGFKGSWMCHLLLMMGAEVLGFSLEPPTNPNLFNVCKLENKVASVSGDIRDFDLLLKTFREFKPEIVIHMAAQPLVRESYKKPVYTFDVNIMGAVNVLECVRLCDSVKSFVNVTTDKVYKNFEWDRGYYEDDILGGFDPYSNSKSCSELVTDSYKNSFFGGPSGTTEEGRIVAISTCRAGNVLGGGDFACDRIIPDCFRAVEKGETIIVRNPFSVRPYQHVLDPITAYLTIAMEQYNDISKADSYNIGPEEEDCIHTGELVDLFCDKWNISICDLNKATRQDVCVEGPHEASFLKLDCSKVKSRINWTNKWHIDKTMDNVVSWYKEYMRNEDMYRVTMKQICEYLEE